MIQVQNITFAHSGEPLYEDASFSIPKGKKVGLVGLNGAGKSTLFSLLCKQEWPDEGKIRVEGSIGYVPQEVGSDKLQQKSKTVREYLASAGDHQDHDIVKLMHKMELKKVDLDDVPSELSGGQKTKLALLHALLTEPDILLLDEPTNFMDIEGKKWVMHWLSQYKKTVFVVSHDLNLLDRHIEKIIYVNKQTKKFEEYTGTYSKFKKLKAEKDAHLTRYIRNQQQSVKRMKKSVEKLRRSNVEKVIRQRVQMEKRISKIEDSLPSLPKEVTKIKLELPTPSHMGILPVFLENVSKSYGDNLVLGDISLSIEKGQRVALIGHNGVGKSTLIKIILGLIEADNGEVRLDERIHVGYYSQELEAFDFTKSLYETVSDVYDVTEGKIRGFLAKFMFDKDKIFQRVGSLSGGEKTRLSIALLMLRNYNFLVLDEPTTYLDTMSQSIILDALKEYKGTMLVVSHTADFLKGLRPDKALLLPDEKYVYWDNDLLGRVVEI